MPAGVDFDIYAHQRLAAGSDRGRVGLGGKLGVLLGQGASRKNKRQENWPRMNADERR